MRKIIRIKSGCSRSSHLKSFWNEELKRVQESRVDESSKRRLVENQDTIDELTAWIQEIQIEVNCMNDLRYFKDAESVRSGLSHVPSQPALLPPYRDPGGPPDNWDAHVFSGNVFVNPRASSSSPHPGGFNPWIPNVTEHTSPQATSERQTPDTALDPRCQSGTSARNSTLMREDFQRIMVRTNIDCRFRIFILTNSLLQQHLPVGR